MPAIDVTVEHSDGSTDDLTANMVEEVDEFERVQQASIYVDRDQIAAISLDEGRDRIEVDYGEGVAWEGVLHNVIRGEANVELIADSPERWAMDAVPSDGSLIFENASVEMIVQDAVDDVPGLTIAEMDEVYDDLIVTLVFDWASPAKRIRVTAEAVGAEVFYDTDGLHFVEDLGEDKTETTISPSNQNLSDHFEPEQDSGEERGTHLILLGKGESDGQTHVRAVPDDDPEWDENDPRDAGYDEDEPPVIVYENDDWGGDPDDAAWRTRADKDLGDVVVLAEKADVVIHEIQQSYEKIQTTVEDEEVHLGDVFHIENEAEAIDTDLRAIEVVKVTSSEGVVYETTFSNRHFTVEPPAEQQIRDTDRYNLAFEGSNVQLGDTEGWSAVSDNVPYEATFYYPAEVKHEARLELLVQGRPYRTYSRGAADGGSTERTTSSTTPSHTHDVTITVPFHAHDISTFSEDTGTAGSHDHGFSWDFHDHDGDVTSYSHNHSFSSADGHWHTYDKVEPTTGGPTSASTDTETSDSGGGSHSHSVSIPDHTHDPEPGLEIFPDLVPENCTVYVNGQEIQNSIGDGDPFEERIDIRGMIPPGDFFNVDVESDETGEVNITFAGDVYRQILGDG